MKKKIVHLTSVHTRYDSRIFVKECIQLAQIKDNEVYLIVADGLGDEIKNNVKIFDVGKATSRIDRIFFITKKIYKKVKEIGGDICHLHDPELIPVGLKLRRIGYTIIFDAHENYMENIKSKVWIPAQLRKIVSKSFEYYYHISMKKYDGVVAPVEYILESIENTNKILFRNLPNTEYIQKSIIDVDKKDNLILYTGGLTKYRGVEQLVKALIRSKRNDWKLVIVGNSLKEVENSLINELKDSRIEFLGLVSFQEVVKFMCEAKVGVVINQPVFSFDKALPNKLFEYMSVGLPVVCSNFKRWQEIVEDNQAGLVCDPTNYEDITNKIFKIVDNKPLSESMAINGRTAILNKYSSVNEVENLDKLYKKVINQNV